MTPKMAVARDLFTVRLLGPVFRSRRKEIELAVTDMVGHRIFGTARAPMYLEIWADLIDRKVIDPHTLRLTEAGRDSAMQWLGATRLPPRAKWVTIRGRHLVARALTGRADERFVTALANDGPDVRYLKALALARMFGLDPAGVDGLFTVVARIVYDRFELGPAKGVQFRAPPAFVNRLIEREYRPVRPGVTALRLAVIRKFVDELIDRPMLDLDAFAEHVRAAARNCPTGKFGPRKTFIHHVWNHLRSLGHYPHLAETEFRRMLTECHTTGRLRLARADLVGLLPADEVLAAATPLGNVVFHFVES